jgi:hypothetical protein
MTKAVLKAMEDLRVSAETCPDMKTQKRLVKIESVLRDALHSASQRGGMASLTPAMLNVSGDFIDTSREVMNAGQAGHGLLNIPAPFSSATMGAGAVLTETTAPLYMPSSMPAAAAAAAPAAQAGGGKRRGRKTKGK